MYCLRLISLVLLLLPLRVFTWLVVLCLLVVWVAFLFGCSCSLLVACFVSVLTVFLVFCYFFVGCYDLWCLIVLHYCVRFCISFLNLVNIRLLR